METEKSIALFKRKEIKCDWCKKKIYGDSEKHYIPETGDLNGENKDTILCKECGEKHETKELLRKKELETGIKYRLLK